MKNDNGFTLVELLAVIAILSILVIIALPNIVNMFNNAKKSLFLTQAQKIYNETSRKYIDESMKGNKITNISSKNDSKLDITGKNLDYCIILNDNGNVSKFAVGDDSFFLILNDVNGVESITKDSIRYGKLKDMLCDGTFFEVKLSCESKDNVYEPGGYYSYSYNNNAKGWNVQLNDKNATYIDTPLCSTINDKPVINMSNLFEKSQATKVDLSTFDTSKVTNMENMFRESEIEELDLSTFDTSNVLWMSGMFYKSKAKNIVFSSSFDTKKVKKMENMFRESNVNKLDLSSFNTSNVENMKYMFYKTLVDTIDLSSFDTSKVTDMYAMFQETKATIGYARTQSDADKFNSTHLIPNGLKFVVKN